MKTLVVYESMYGNTHAIASQIGAGMGVSGDVKVVPVTEASSQLLDWADVIVVGGPTHVHGMASHMTRKGAVKDATDKDLTLEPDAEGPGLRDWFDEVPDAAGKRAVAFDTRLEGSPLLTGRASKGISKRLRKHGFHVFADAESFTVDKHNELTLGEADRAKDWGEQLTKSLSA